MFEPVSLTQIALFGFAVDVAYSSFVGVLAEVGGQMPLFCRHRVTVKRKKDSRAGCSCVQLVTK